ncbi:MAG: PT domain-containing protein, partial [Ruminococcus sp.]|nr:PT domain-containing protein [Ruminococcus sp.]
AVSQAASLSQTAPAVSPTGSSNSSSTPFPTVKPTASPTVSPTVKPTGSPTVPPTVKPTAAPTEPATYATQPLTAPTEIKPTVPATIPATLPKEEELYYMGRFIFHAGQGSVFADSASVSVTLSQSGYAYSNLTVPLRSDGTGKKRGVLPIYEEAILLYTDSACTVTVSDDGHTVSKTVFLTFGNDVIINL